MARVGLIEDCPVSRSLLTEMISNNGWEAVEFENIEEAKVCDAPLDVLLVDMDKLEGMNHMSELKEVPQVEKGLAVIPFFGNPKSKFNLELLFVHTDRGRVSLASSVRNILEKLEERHKNHGKNR